MHLDFLYQVSAVVIDGIAMHHEFRGYFIPLAVKVSTSSSRGVGKSVE
jgi:hypothetical protein